MSDTIYRVMVEMLNQSKKIDELKLMPAYVKDGEVFDFNNRLLSKTSKADGEIFNVDKVITTQAVTAVLKKNYTTALTEWLDSPNEVSINLVGLVVNLIENDEFKGAKQLVKDNKEHTDYKKAKKLIKNA